MGEHLERETGKFYNGSFHKTERDNNKHQKKASLKTENNLFFVTVVDE